MVEILIKGTLQDGKWSLLYRLDDGPENGEEILADFCSYLADRFGVSKEQRSESQRILSSTVSTLG